MATENQFQNSLIFSWLNKILGPTEKNLVIVWKYELRNFLTNIKIPWLFTEDSRKLKFPDFHIFSSIATLIITYIFFIILYTKLYFTLYYLFYRYHGCAVLKSDFSLTRCAYLKKNEVLILLFFFVYRLHIQFMTLS